MRTYANFLLSTHFTHWNSSETTIFINLMFFFYSGLEYKFSRSGVCTNLEIFKLFDNVLVISPTLADQHWIYLCHVVIYDHKGGIQTGIKNLWSYVCLFLNKSKYSLMESLKFIRNESKGGKVRDSRKSFQAANDKLTYNATPSPISYHLN